MDAITYNKTISLIEEMKKFEAMKETWEAQLPDPLAKIMVIQCQDSMRNLLRQLIAELFQSGLSLKSFEYFFRTAAVYLKKNESGEELDETLKANLAEVEKML